MKRDRLYVSVCAWESEIKSERVNVCLRQTEHLCVCNIKEFEECYGHVIKTWVVLTNG